MRVVFIFRTARLLIIDVSSAAGDRHQSLFSLAFRHLGGQRSGDIIGRRWRSVRVFFAARRQRPMAHIHFVVRLVVILHVHKLPV